MLPNNTKESGCVATSSNCVVWQGPDIKFLNLSKGDSVSGVIHGIAEKICAIMSQLNPSNLDFACLDITDCPPETFNDLFQILIDEVCQLKQDAENQTVSQDLTEVQVGIPACLQDEVGASFAALDVAVAAMGKFICEQQATIAGLNSSIATLTSKVGNLESTINSITGG